MFVRRAVMATLTGLPGIAAGLIEIDGSRLLLYTCVNVTQEFPQARPWALNDEYYLSTLHRDQDPGVSATRASTSSTSTTRPPAGPSRQASAPPCCTTCESVGGSPGRAGHRLAVEAGRVVYEARESSPTSSARDDPESVILLKNATEALNLAILGTLDRGDRVVVSALEHNSVMRPLRHLEATLDVEVDVVECDPDGALDTAGLARALKEPTHMVVVTHASNVTGALAPLERIADIAHAAGATLLVDAAQTAGAYAIDVTAMGIDYLAFTGHKSLFGPQGTGGLVIHRTATPADVRRHRQQLGGGATAGATIPIGSRAARSTASASQAWRPGSSTSGSGPSRPSRDVATRCWSRLLEGLLAIDGVQVHGPADPERQIGVVSITFERALAGRGRPAAGRRLRRAHSGRPPLLRPAAHRSHRHVPHRDRPSEPLRHDHRSSTSSGPSRPCASWPASDGRRHPQGPSSRASSPSKARCRRCAQRSASRRWRGLSPGADAARAQLHLCAGTRPSLAPTRGRRCSPGGGRLARRGRLPLSTRGRRPGTVGALMGRALAALDGGRRHRRGGRAGRHHRWREPAGGLRLLHHLPRP